MWDTEQVGRALFRWEKWRASLVRQWMRKTPLSKISLKDLKTTARTALHELGLKGPIIECYWICAVDTVRNLDDVAFEEVFMPEWFPKRYDHRMKQFYLNQRHRFYPPVIITEMDLLKLKSYNPQVYHKLEIREMTLTQHHPLYTILGMKGRPKKQSAIGRPSEYSDHCAVVCAAHKRQGLTYVEIAKKFKLPIIKNRETGYKQSESARNLVERGKKLIEEYNLDSAF